MEGVSPTARAAHGCAVIGSRMFIFGGLSPSGPLNDLFVLDTGELRLANTLGREKQSCVCVCVWGGGGGMCVHHFCASLYVVMVTCANLPMFLRFPAVVPG